MPEARAASVNICVTVGPGTASVNVAVNASAPEPETASVVTETVVSAEMTPKDGAVAVKPVTTKERRSDYPDGFDYLNDLEPYEIPECIRKCAAHTYVKRGSNGFINRWKCKKCDLVCVHHIAGDEREWFLATAA